MIKLVAMDLDNTLLNKDGTISANTLSLIHELNKNGVHFAVATGRSFHSANYIADKISMDAPVICYNGALIKDASNNVLFESGLDYASVKEILSFAYENDIYVQLYDKDVIVVDRLRPEMHPDPDLKFTDYREVGNLLKVKPFKTPKMLLATDPAKVPFFQKELERRYSDSLFFAQSEPHLIEVMPKGVDKGAALKRLANILGIELKETMAMGDNTNDILLLQAAGVAVAVANAVPKVKAVADYVCKNTRSRGVAEALKRFCL